MPGSIVKHLKGSTFGVAKKSKVLSQIGTILIVFFLLPNMLAGQANPRENIFKDGGFYIGVYIGASDGPSGKYLNGQYSLIEENELYLIPQVERGFVLTFLLGQRKRPGAWEVGFATSRPTGNIMNLDATIDTKEVFIRGKRYIFPNSRIQPCLILGANYYRLSTQDASISLDFPNDIGPAVFSGLGVEAGLGLSGYLNRIWTVHFSFIYSYEIFLWSKGALKESRLMTSSNVFFGGGYSVSAGISWTF